MRDDEVRVRPGRAGRSATGSTVAQILRAANSARTLARAASRPSAFGRGRIAALTARGRTSAKGRRVTIKARVVRQRAGAAPLSTHLAYLQRDGVSRDGSPGEMFDRDQGGVDPRDFAERCSGDRHHFRFIVSPEDGATIDNLRPFTRELMRDMAQDLSTRLDWIAVEHRNTAHPHVHVLVRGRTDDGQNLVIARDYIREGMRARAERLLTIELGPRTEREQRRALDAQITADRLTPLDRGLVRMADERHGIVDLRPRRDGPASDFDAARLGRMRKLEGLGLAVPVGPAQWRIGDGTESTLQALGERGDIIKRLHRAMTDRAADEFVVAGERQSAPVVGRLVARGLDDELRGTAYTIVDGVDGKLHHLRLPNLEATSDAAAGAIVELTRSSAGSSERLALTVRSDLDLAAQATATGATWLDRKLLERDRAFAETGFGREVGEALGARREHLEGAGLARRQGQRWLFARDLLDTLREAELSAAGSQLQATTGLAAQPSGEGEQIGGTYRRRLSLASGRFAMLDDGTGFALVPWTPALERHLGAHVSGVVRGSGIDWSFQRTRDLGL